MKTNPNQPTYIVGYRFTNKQGLNAEVIAYRGRKDIDIRFEDGAIVKSTTGSYIAKGFPMHPTLGKVQVGDIFPCEDGDSVEVIKYDSFSRVLAKWKSNGAEKWTTVETLRQGRNKNPQDKYSEGDIVKTNFHGSVEVIEYRGALDILVKFENGSMKSVSASALKNGNIRPDDFFSSRVGHKFTTNSGWGGEIIDWNSANDVNVQWQDGSISNERWAAIKCGGIKPLYQPSVLGVGYVGDGRFLPGLYKLSEGKEHLHPRIYAYWQRMLSRCYNEKEQAKPSARAYIGCSVSEEWKCLQNFAEWALSKEQAFFTENGKIWELDKDILVRGNRLYSDVTCTFLPPEINIFLSDRSWSENCPRGTNYIRPPTPGSKEGWIARCHINGKREYLGYYDDPMSAFFAYKTVKEGHAKMLAEKYKHRLEEQAYLSLLEYTVSPYTEGP